MKNRELIEYLIKLPSEYEVLVNRNGSIYTEVDKPTIRFMGTSQKEYIVLSSKIPL